MITTRAPDGANNIFQCFGQHIALLQRLRDLFAILILPSVGARGAEYGETAPAVPRNPSRRASKPLQLKIKTPSQYF